MSDDNAITIERGESLSEYLVRAVAFVSTGHSTGWRRCAALFSAHSAIPVPNNGCAGLYLRTSRVYSDALVQNFHDDSNAHIRVANHKSATHASVFPLYSVIQTEHGAIDIKTCVMFLAKDGDFHVLLKED